MPRLAHPVNTWITFWDAINWHQWARVICIGACMISCNMSNIIQIHDTHYAPFPSALCRCWSCIWPIMKYEIPLQMRTSSSLRWTWEVLSLTPLNSCNFLASFGSMTKLVFVWSMNAHYGIWILHGHLPCSPRVLLTGFVRITYGKGDIFVVSCCGYLCGLPTLLISQRGL